ncbi:hypothetical protein RFI_30536 [Reticulomyxa filosa]|uniref:Transmembrane protein n=1 Tax=Reticulomyxa filosa TaxID=46433 RepID=X6LY71_RETFI|nr:hypothetical protein RFI_30536 [Reticulomyxa filosa]|eukprot:ETO06858.1 hypothetical protein RFI_30536 [Reticulomyxa filosa]
MRLNAQHAGFRSELALYSNLTFSLFGSVYCLCLLYVVWRNLWAVTRERVGSELAKEIQLSVQKSGTITELSVSTSTVAEKSARRQIVIDKKVKWIVTLSAIGCFLACAGNACEHLAYALMENVEVCYRGLRVIYVRVFTQGLLYAFYVVRATVLLQGSAFEIPNWIGYFLAITPMATFAIALFGYNLFMQFSHCNYSNPVASSLLLSSVCLNIFWNITLFTFLLYHIHKYVVFLFEYFSSPPSPPFLSQVFLEYVQKKKKIANEKAMVNHNIQKDLKDYMKKLLRLFLIKEIVATALYLSLFVPGWYDAFWSMTAIDNCVNCSSMLLSFAFAKPIFDAICLCKC